MTAPQQAICRSRLPDGTLLTVTATRRERAGRADVKCTVPGDPYLAERIVANLEAECAGRRAVHAAKEPA
jgi:hypothetical protein